MYRRCLFCQADLGENQIVEHLPIGRRLAFDAAKGRLWVVCRKCERWNLTPFDDRWEAIDECEREYRSTTRRFATDNIGLARLAEGLELVRIGEPLRPEFAAWRYGDQFGRRRRRYVIITAALVTGGIGLAFAPALAGISVGGGGFYQIFSGLHHLIRAKRKVATIDDGAGTPLRVSIAQIENARLVADRNEHGWSLLVPRRGDLSGRSRSRSEFITLEGPTALDAAAKILPRLNRSGGSQATVQSAVKLMESADTVDAFFRDAARRAGPYVTGRSQQLTNTPKDFRLALEMATHEDMEKVWLAGELLDLERAWREAEEIAAIADTLGVPTELDRQFDEIKHRER
jgi:hypothetical protein